MTKVKLPNKYKYNGKWYATGDVIEVDDKHIGQFPKESVLKKTPQPKQQEPKKELTDLSDDELYTILQELDVSGRTKIREAGTDAMVAAIEVARSG